MTYALHDADRTCGNCTHWNENYKVHLPVSGRTNGGVAQMCPCMAALDDDSDKAPFADVGGPGLAVVMTRAEHHCDAFDLHQDSVDMIEDLNRTDEVHRWL